MFTTFWSDLPLLLSWDDVKSQYFPVRVWWNCYVPNWFGQLKSLPNVCFIVLHNMMKKIDSPDHTALVRVLRVAKPIRPGKAWRNQLCLMMIGLIVHVDEEEPSEEGVGTKWNILFFTLPSGKSTTNLVQRETTACMHWSRSRKRRRKSEKHCP